VISPEIVQSFFGATDLFNLMAAGIGVGILSIPLVASVSEDAMRAVPSSLREASSGLGARKMHTTLRVVLPAAVSGLVAAFILAVSRAIGETMVVFIAAGAASVGQY
jgi:phosphate transport system permease protein